MLSSKEFERNIAKYRKDFYKRITLNYQNLPFYRVLDDEEQFYRYVNDKKLFSDLIRNPVIDINVLKYFPYPTSINDTGERVYNIPNFEKIIMYYYNGELDENGNPVNVGNDFTPPGGKLKITPEEYNNIGNSVTKSYFTEIEAYKSLSPDTNNGDDAFYIEYKSEEIAKSNAQFDIFYKYPGAKLKKPLQNISELDQISIYNVNFTNEFNPKIVLVPSIEDTGIYPDTIFDVLLLATSRWGSTMDKFVDSETLKFVREIYYIKYHPIDRADPNKVLELARKDWRVYKYVDKSAWTDDLIKIILSHDGTLIEEIVETIFEQNGSDYRNDIKINEYILLALNNNPNSVKNVFNLIRKYPEHNFYLHKTDLTISDEFKTAIVAYPDSLKYIPMYDEEWYPEEICDEDFIKKDPRKPMSVGLYGNLSDALHYSVDGESKETFKIYQNMSLLEEILSSHPEMIIYADERIIYENRDIALSVVKQDGMLLKYMYCFNGYRSSEKFNRLHPCDEIPTTCLNEMDVEQFTYKDFNIIMEAIRQNQNIFDREYINFGIFTVEEIFKIITEFPNLYIKLNAAEKEKISKLLSDLKYDGVDLDETCLQWIIL